MKKLFSILIMLLLAAALLAGCVSPNPAILPTGSPEPQASGSLEPQKSPEPEASKSPEPQKSPVASPSSAPSAALTIPDGALHLYYLPVGDADCCLAVSPEGKLMLIDTGLPETYEQVRDFLRSMDIKRLDFVVLTHPHTDHIGGMSKLVEDFSVETIYFTQRSSDSKTYEEMQNALAAHSLRTTKAEAGVSFDFGTVKAEFLAPLDGIESDNENAFSAVLRLTYNSRKYMLMGDALKATEERLVEKYGAEAMACDVLKCGHHGEGDATKKRFLEATNPTYVIMSAGEAEDHAEQKVIDRIKESGAELFCTKWNGMIHVRQEGELISVSAQKS